MNSRFFLPNFFVVVVVDIWHFFVRWFDLSCIHIKHLTATGRTVPHAVCISSFSIPHYINDFNVNNVGTIFA